MHARETKTRAGDGDGAFWAGVRRRHVAAVAAAPDLSGWPPGLAALVVDYLGWARGVPLRLGACSRDDSDDAAPARRALHALDEGVSPPRWVALAPLPAGCFAPAAMRRADGALLVAGGVAACDDGDLGAWVAAATQTRLYCPGAGGWATRASAADCHPLVRCGGQAGAVLGAHAYVVGGVLRSMRGAAAGVLMLDLASESGERFDAWPAAADAPVELEALPPMAGDARAHHAALGLEADAPGDAGCGGRLFVFGGLGCAGGGGSPCDAHAHGALASVECLDVGGAHWRACAPMPRARSHGCAAGPLPDGRIALLGGLAAGGALLEEVDVYDPLHDAWRAAPEWRLPRAATLARLWPTQAEVARGGAALLVTADEVVEEARDPGDGGDGTPMRTIVGTSSWLLDMATGTWAQLPEPSLVAAPAP